MARFAIRSLRSSIDERIDMNGKGIGRSPSWLGRLRYCVRMLASRARRAEAGKGALARCCAASSTATINAAILIEAAQLSDWIVQCA